VEKIEGEVKSYGRQRRRRERGGFFQRLAAPKRIGRSGNQEHHGEIFAEQRQGQGADGQAFPGWAFVIHAADPGVEAEEPEGRRGFVGVEQV